MDRSNNNDNTTNEKGETKETPTIHLSSILDSKTGQLDDVLMEKLEEACHQETSQVHLHRIAKIASEHDPIDLAYAVSKLPPQARLVVYENLPDMNAKAVFLIHTGNNTRATIFRQIPETEITELLEMIPSDEAVVILDDMSDRRMKRVLELLDIQKANRIRELLKHDRHSAGRLMSNEFFAFKMNATIREVAAAIRENPGIDLTRNIFVISDHEELVGYVPVRNLVVNQPFLPLRQVMRPILHMVTPSSSRDEVVDIVERYGAASLPVVDDKHRLVGVIAYEDVVEAMEDIADETIASIAGTGEVFGEDEPIFKRFLWRAPWLLVTLCAGMFTSSAMAHFSDRVWFTIVPFFVPLIAGMSGNIGLQCSTILVRGMATGELTPGERYPAMMKELMIGLLIGLAFGILCAVLLIGLHWAGITSANTDIAPLVTTVSAGVFGASMTAAVLGTLSPFAFARLGVDPAVASGPIVTACNDVTSTLMFFLVARIVYLIFT